MTGYATPVWKGPRNWYEREVLILPVTYEHVGTSFRLAIVTQLDSTPMANKVIVSIM